MIEVAELGKSRKYRAARVA